MRCMDSFLVWPPLAIQQFGVGENVGALQHSQICPDFEPHSDSMSWSVATYTHTHPTSIAAFADLSWFRAPPRLRVMSHGQWPPTHTPNFHCHLPRFQIKYCYDDWQELSGSCLSGLLNSRFVLRHIFRWKKSIVTTMIRLHMVSQPSWWGWRQQKKSTSLCMSRVWHPWHPGPIETHLLMSSGRALERCNCYFAEPQHLCQRIFPMRRCENYGVKSQFRITVWLGRLFAGAYVIISFASVVSFGFRKIPDHSSGARGGIPMPQRTWAFSHAWLRFLCRLWSMQKRSGC